MYCIYLSLIYLLCSSFALITNYGFVNKEQLTHLDIEYRKVGKAQFRTQPVKGSHEHYTDAHANLFLSHYLNKHNALSWQVGYSFLQFNWPQNPGFHADDYHFATASLGWISTSLKNWRWILSTALSVDAQTFDFGQSAVYYAVMWGRYQWKPQVGLHIGWYGYAGVKNGYLLPIAGIDWHPSKSWQINAIFPVDASIRYFFNQHWSIYLQASAFGRPYRFPIRAREGIGRYRNAIFEVFSTGLELNVKYALNHTLHFIAGGGWNFGGWILIKDHNNNHGKYYRFDDAPYAQAKLAWSF